MCKISRILLLNKVNKRKAKFVGREINVKRKPRSVVLQQNPTDDTNQFESQARIRGVEEGMVSNVKFKLSALI